jgi:hypothetical protein
LNLSERDRHFPHFLRYYEQDVDGDDVHDEAVYDHVDVVHDVVCGVVDVYVDHLDYDVVHDVDVDAVHDVYADVDDGVDFVRDVCDVVHGVDVFPDVDAHVFHDVSVHAANGENVDVVHAHVDVDELHDDVDVVYHPS